jgi:hypothetical protein
MLRMDQVHVVRHKVLVEGRAISAVAREMEMSPNTIRKYLSLSEPKRVVRRPKASPKTELVAPGIDELLEEWRGGTTPKSSASPGPGFIANLSRRDTKWEPPPYATTFGRSGAKRRRCSSRSFIVREMRRGWTSSR